MSRLWSGCVAALVLTAACRRPSENKPALPPSAPASTQATAPVPGGPPADAEHSPSGLASKVLRPGKGAQHPEPQDLVEVHFSSWSRDGKLFDSSIPRSAPAQFEVGSAIKGWSEGIAAMVVGEKRRLWVPEALAYGDHPPEGVPPGPLVFDIELLKIIKKPRPPAVPEDVQGPPAGAQRTPSGLSYRVLRPGTGAAHPRPGSTVEVHYSGWTPDGRLFDSSVVREQPATFKIGAPGLIEGWNQALRQMVVGEKARFWIPPALGYGKKVTGGPTGMLVFDVELLAIK